MQLKVYQKKKKESVEYGLLFFKSLSSHLFRKGTAAPPLFKTCGFYFLRIQEKRCVEETNRLPRSQLQTTFLHFSKKFEKVKANVLFPI